MLPINYLKLGFLSIIILIFTYSSKGQSDNEAECKVLLSTISEEYNGACKEGLAHGKGLAKGVDTYEGKFKNGLPHGKGKYVWANGDIYNGVWKFGKKSGKAIMYTASTQKEIKGIWKNDEFYKEIVDPPYSIVIREGVTGVNFYEKSDKEPHRIEVSFQRDGSKSSIVNNLDLMSSTGMSTISNGFTGYENMQFPFEGTIEFTAISRMGTTTINYKVRFEITTPTNWEIIIRY